MLKKPNPRGAPIPLVEAITKYPGDWEITDRPQGGETDNVGHRMWAPLDDEPCRCGTAHNYAIRGHELLHSKLSPEQSEAIKVATGSGTIEVSQLHVVVAEEARINYSLAQIEGAQVAKTLFCPHDAESSVSATMDSGKYEEIINLAVCSPHNVGHLRKALSKYQKSLGTLERGSKTGAERAKTLEFVDRKRKIAAALNDAVGEYAHIGERIMAEHPRGKLPSWSQTEKLAAFLEVNLRNFGDQLKKLTEASPDPDLDAVFGEMVEAYAKRDAESSPLGPRADVKSGTSDGAKFGIVTTPSGDHPDREGPLRWGKPKKIGEAKMPLAMPPWKIQKANRAVDEGTIPRYMHRWVSDKRVFHRSKRLPGGSILIDDSGSMGLTAAQLDAMIEIAPAATVALYAGRDSGDGGEIRVVAKDGRRAKPEDLSIEEYGGNGIDGPALEWLGTQEYPRVWITDGGVSASGEWGPRVIQAAMDLCRKHKITAVSSAKEAAEVLKTGRLAR